MSAHERAEETEEEASDAESNTFLGGFVATVEALVTIANWIIPSSSPTSSRTSAVSRGTSPASAALEETPTDPDRGYIPLGANETRLIKVDAISEVTLNCTLETSSLENPPGYIALSYAWSRDANYVSITYNNQPQQISRDLFDAISSIAQRSRGSLLWIDQISIDQDNDEEKSVQVGLMAQIFGKAEKTYIWLGQEGADSARAFALLERLRSNVELYVSSPDKLDEYLRKNGRSELKAVIDLVCRRWFSRIWVLQEACLSQHAIVLCGGSEMRWPDFHSGLHVLIVTGTISNALNAWAPRSLPDRPKQSQLFSVEEDEHGYEVHFQSYCQAISLGTARNLLSDHAVPGDKLSQILHLCDVRKSGTLYYPQFILALHLCKAAALGIEPPKVLTTDLKRELFFMIDGTFDSDSPSEIGSRLLTFVQVQSAIQRRREGGSSDVMKSVSKGHTTEDLRFLLRHGSRFNCTDHRDKLFAILALCKDTFGLAPNYTCQPDELYRDIALGLLQGDSTCDCIPGACPLNKLFVFSLVGGGEAYELPSWVPSWNRTNPESLWDLNTCLGFNPTQTSVNLRSVHEDRGELELSGMIFDGVALLTDPHLPDRSHLEGPLQGFLTGLGTLIFGEDSRIGRETVYSDVMRIIGRWKWITEAARLISKGTAYSKEVEQRTAFWRTLCVDSCIADHEWDEVVRPKRISVEAIDTFDKEFTKAMGYIAELHGLYELGRMQKMMNLCIRRTAQGDLCFFQKALVNCIEHRRFFVTKSGYMGLGPETLKKEDIICCFHGAPLPMILRRFNDTFKLVGECYVHGIMDGELTTRMPPWPSQVIRLS